jgi:hypothetical protein
MCAACYQRWKISTNPSYKAKQRAGSRRWAKSNPERYKDAVKAGSAKWYTANKKAVADRAFVRRSANPAYYLWRLAKRRALQQGVPFSLQPQDIVVPSTCPVLGIPLILSRQASPSDNSPSVDRIVPTLGYTPGNIRVVSFRANRIKTDATPEELKKVAAYAMEETCRIR